MLQGGSPVGPPSTVISDAADNLRDSLAGALDIVRRSTEQVNDFLDKVVGPRPPSPTPGQTDRNCNSLFDYCQELEHRLSDLQSALARTRNTKL